VCTTGGFPVDSLHRAPTTEQQPSNQLYPPIDFENQF
jgi:hypothetical protein